MRRRINSIVGHILSLLGLAAGCGRTGEPTATSASPMQKAPEQTMPPESAGHPSREVDDMQTAELDLAIEEYTETIALDSQDAKAYNDRGVAYYYKGDLEQAIADYDQAIAIDPQLALAYRNRAAAYAMTGQYDRALADCDKVLELDPANATVYWFRGLVHKVIGEREEAIAAISQRDLRSSNGAGPCAWVPHSAILLPQLAQQRPCVALGNLATVISIQHPCCFSKGGWPQAVPGGGDFVIEARVNALIAGCEQLAACLSQGNGGCYKAYSHSVLRNPICPE